MHKNALYDLIQSLTSAEKRSIKILMSGQGKTGDQKYLKLFDAIAAQKEYDEVKLTKKFGYTNNLNGLSVAKNYLFNMILRCMRFSGKSSTAYFGMSDLLSNIEILYLKRQFESCKKMVDKAMGIAIENGWNDLIVLVCSWERKLLEHLLDASDYMKAHESIIEREKQAVRDMKLNNNYFSLYQRLRVLNFKYGFIKKGEVLTEFNNLIKDPLLENYDNARTLLSKMYFLSFYSEYYEALREHEERFIWNEQLIQLFEGNASLKKTFPDRYLNALFNYLFNLLELKQYELFEREVGKLTKLKLPAHEYELKKKKERAYLFLYLFFYNNTNQVDKALDVIIPGIEKYFEKNNNIVNKLIEGALLANAAWTYYVSGNFDKALEWIVLVDRYVDRNVFVDVYIRSRVLLMAIHYELENFQYLDSLVNSTLRFLESRDKLNTLESFYLKFFKKAIALDRDAKSQKQALLDLKEDIKTILNYVQEKSIFDLRVFLWWVDSQLNNVPVATIIQAYFDRTNKARQDKIA